MKLAITIIIIQKEANPLLFVFVFYSSPVFFLGRILPVEEGRGGGGGGYMYPLLSGNSNYLPDMRVYKPWSFLFWRQALRVLIQLALRREVEKYLLRRPRVAVHARTTRAQTSFFGNRLLRKLLAKLALRRERGRGGRTPSRIGRDVRGAAAPAEGGRARPIRYWFWFFFWGNVVSYGVKKKGGGGGMEGRGGKGWKE